MTKVASSFLGIIFFFGAFSSSPTYNLNSYSVGPAGTNNTSSSTYHAQANIGENAGKLSSTTYAGKNGAIAAEQLGAPGAPTLSNGLNTYYNKLQFTLNTNGLPADAKYVVAVSTNSFATTSYVQADGTLGASVVYQTYTAWGGSGGSFITGLMPSTTYEVKVAAKQGLFTSSDFGPFASASTVAPSITFSLSPNSMSLGNLLPGTVLTSGAVTFNLTTNAASGGNIFAAGLHGGLYSTSKNALIAALTGNLGASSHGFGLQALTASQTSGGPLSIVSPYNGTGNSIGSESATYASVLSSPAAVQGGTATLDMQAKSNATDPSASDYQEVLTFVAAASF